MYVRTISSPSSLFLPSRCFLQGGGGLVHQLKKSYSLTDLSKLDEVDFNEEDDGAGRPSQRAIGYNDNDRCKREREARACMHPWFYALHSG